MYVIPAILQAPMSDITDYVGKNIGGASLTELNAKVYSYQKLRHEDKHKLIGYLSQHGNVLVYIAKKTEISSPKTFLFHKKFGYKKQITGYPFFVNIKDYVNSRYCWSCGKEKKVNQFYHANNIQRSPTQTCIDCSKIINKKKVTILNEGDCVFSFQGNQKKELTVENKQMTAQQLRIEAEKLLKEADEAERKAQSNDYVNKTIKPLVHAVLQNATQIQKNVDDLITNTANFEKSISELRKIMN